MKEIEKFVNELFLNVKPSRETFEAKEQLKKELEITLKKWFINKTGLTGMENISEALTRTFGLSEDIKAKKEEKRFGFGDVFNLDNRSMQTLLLNIHNNEVIVYALYELPGNKVERLMLNIPSARREILYEQIKYLTKVNEKDVDKARDTIVQMVLELGKQGKIVI